MAYDINDGVKQEVLAATDLVSLVGAVTALKKAGNSWKGLCPFHTEKTPSFHVHPEKGFYYCFGCGAKGDAITFVRETERMEFPEAVAYLARLAGVRLPERRAGTRADRAKETDAAAAVAAAARLFREQLPRHAVARDLLEKRGIAPAEAPVYGFGAALDSWDALKNELGGTFPEETLIETGLLSKNETGRTYDRFRNRLTIEIRDARGEILGFGARALGDDQPKYLNSPETSRFSKGRILYALDRAKESIRRSEVVLLVEGYFDQIAFEKAGVPNTVASMGTALTPAQCDLLSRHAATVIVAYDGDAPGQAAAWKAFALLLERGVAIRHLVLPDGHDPDSYLALNGAEALAARVAEAPSFLETVVASVPTAGGDPSERAAHINIAMELLKAAKDRVLKHELLSRFATSVGVPLALVSGTGGKKVHSQTVEPRGEAASAHLPESEETVLSTLLAEWPKSAPLVKGLPPEIFMHPASRQLFEALKAVDSSAVTLDFSALVTHLEPGAGL
ncbi:MAG TPA: DNA primase, partial [Thermoanaerobaculia bacterium]|nr:DNA primase [Thermoanaerobaculia bacterium]